jgi:DNA-binding NtrC family response regulator
MAKRVRRARRTASISGHSTKPRRKRGSRAARPVPKYKPIREWLGWLQELPTMYQWEAVLMEEVMRRCDGNKSHAARTVGLTREGFRKKLLRMGLE